MSDRDPSRPLTDAVKAAPFLKWAGGKGQLLDQYEALFPQERVRTYFEPFLGSGAVFFYLRGRDLADRYCLSEINEELINVYRAVRDEVEALIELLTRHRDRHGREHYYAVRAMDRNDLGRHSPVERAARMIYLNKTCYNGLWRVNSKGHFNVPLGRYKKPPILDEARLRAASAALQGVELAVRDFDEGVADAQAGDFIYFDPPYVPLSDTANFTSYSKRTFGEAEQRALAQTFRNVDQRGCRVMLSNADAPLVHDLYDGFRIVRVRARRAINTDARKRGPIHEVVVLNY